MARYKHLPIYKAALDAAAHFKQVVAGVSRYPTYSPDTELRQASRAVNPTGDLRLRGGSDCRNC